MDLAPAQIRHAVLTVIAFVVSVAAHEFGHAWMANRLGDGLPRAQGRLTLSPLAHIDLLGTLALPFFSALLGAPGLAWGKPVQTDPASYTPRLSPRVSRLLVAVMGPAMNLLLAAATSVVFIALAKAGLLGRAGALAIIQYLLALNLVLMVFNLIPLPPLDGGAVLAALLPEALQIIPRTLQRYGMVLFFVLLILSANSSGGGPLGVLLWPAHRLTLLWGGALLRLVPA
jgi:Zn-dependent protease